MAESDWYAQARQRMVETQLCERGIHQQAVLEAFRRVPRHLFVPPEVRRQAYEDYPLAIGSGQTISQPYVVAYMIEKLQLIGTERILEIGTGSGYQTALLAELATFVYSIEFFAELAARAQQILSELGYDNIEMRVGDGNAGWPEAAPFDAIIGSAAPAEIPPLLLQQLSPGGRMILPVGIVRQHLVLVHRTSQGLFQQKSLLPVRFVPMQSSKE